MGGRAPEAGDFAPRLRDTLTRGFRKAESGRGIRG
jgi:hypothetical protein